MEKDKDNKEIAKENELKKKKLDQCTTAPHPEMARNTDSDEPCDDNRA
jgi:hypothetical protein